MAPPNLFVSSTLPGNTPDSDARLSNPPKPTITQVLNGLTSKSSLLHKAAVHVLEQHRYFVVQDPVKASVWLMRMQPQIPLISKVEHSALKLLTRNMDASVELLTLLRALIEDLRMTRKALMDMRGVSFNGFNSKARNAKYEHEARGFEEMITDVVKTWRVVENILMVAF